MVGLVIVSHSAKLAEGVSELAREMGGEEVPIVVAGGTTLEDAPLGTDAVLVAEAIQSAHSSSGVLVLMDLGSAVLSAEMALEMVPDDVRADVTLCSAPLVEGAVAAATAARAGLPLAAVADEARGALRPKLEHIGDAGEQPAREPSATEDAGPTIELDVTNRLGLHARPAARLVRTASSFDARLSIANLTTGAGPGSAQSLNSTIALGVRQGHRIRVSASGPDAAAALEAVAELAADGFGDRDTGAPAAGPEGPDPDATVVATPASPGRAMGPAQVVRTASVSPAAGVDRDDGLSRLDDAIAAAEAGLKALEQRVAASIGDDAAAIFDAHVLLLRDEGLIGPARERIARGEDPAAATMAAGHETAQRFYALDDPYIAARGEDVVEVCERVVAALRGTYFDVEDLGAGVVVTDHLRAAAAAAADPEAVDAIVVATGGAATHASILLRALGIPAVVEAGDSILEVEPGTIVAVDGGSGAVYMDPSEEVRARFVGGRTR